MRAALALSLAAAGCGQPAPAVPLPDFQMSAVEPAGERPFARKDLDGRVWIVDFIFTNCSGTCPVLSGRMAGLSRELPEQVGFLSVSVDPRGDTPERLRRYAAAYGAQPGRWLFLRGDSDSVYRLAYSGFRLPISTRPEAPAESRVVHSSRLALVDAAGRVVGTYDGLDDAAAERLARRARKLVQEGS